ncbi:hypothetical protein ACTNDZ_00980 [Selenomonas montiformis]|uniref:hypothetical protein n=1 Tax=Selenomonas montiformis TaxID=2652285 RepID=UPI003F8BF7AE
MNDSPDQFDIQIFFNEYRKGVAVSLGGVFFRCPKYYQAMRSLEKAAQWFRTYRDCRKETAAIASRRTIR